ncbi:MAG: ATP-binding protein [Actinomycetales bacterium]
MTDSPYTPGESPPPVLSGRGVHLARIRSHLARVVDTGEMAGAPLVFIAPRGIGKTSLLRVAEQQAQAQGLVTVWVACVRGAGFLADLDAELAARLAALDYAPSTTRISAYQVEVGVGVAKAGIAVEREQSQGPQGLVHAVERALAEAGRTVREHGGAGVAVFLDELHAPDLRDTAVLLNAVQNLAARGTGRPASPVAVVAAGLPSTPAQLTRAATFGERSTFVALDRLDEADSLRALIDPAIRVGVHWTADAARVVGQAARGFPYFVQLLGKTSWEAAQPEHGDVITIDHVRAGAGVANTQVSAMFGARWDAATDAERDFMEAMAAIGDGDVQRSQIAAALGRTTRQISVPRARLIDRGIIEPTGHGLVRFTLPGFAAYVRALGGQEPWQPLELPGHQRETW